MHPRRVPETRRVIFIVKPKISVITINFNDVDGLYGTLASIAAQTSDAFELVVVDGGSKDGSPKVLEDFDGLIDLWVSEPDKGIYDAMNKGVALASGEYVNFMNSGDCFFDAEVLSKACEIIDSDGPDLFCGHAYAMHSNKRYQYNSDLWKGMVCSHQATFSRRALNQRFPFSLDYKIAADYRFYVQCEEAGASPVKIDLDAALIDTSGVSFHGLKARTFERLRICQDYYRSPDVYRYFCKLAEDNDLTLPDWAATEERWMHGAQ